MRIVHVADSFAPDIGGIERQVETLARSQQAQGHDVTVLTAVNEPAEMDLDVLRALPGRWLTVAFPWRNHRLVAHVLDGRKVDVVHAHLSVVTPLAIYTTRRATRRSIPVAVTVHSLWWKVTAATRISNMPFGFGRTEAAWSAVSNVAAGHVSRTLPRVGPISVVPNLVDTQWWTPLTAQPLRSDGEIRLILVGRLKKRKHVREFIDVLAQARRQLPTSTRVRVDVIGEGPRHQDLQEQIDALGLTDWVSLLGQRSPEQVRTLLHHADLFVATSRQESFGIAALEARAAGLPVLGYLGNGLSDFISDDVDGVLVADADQMAAALVRLIGQPSELARLRKTTTTTGPIVTPGAALEAVDSLYERAMAMHTQRR